MNPGGVAVIDTFALNGPLECGNLDVMCYEEARTQLMLGADFLFQAIRRKAPLSPCALGFVSAQFQRLANLRLKEIIREFGWPLFPPESVGWRCDFDQV